MVGWQDGSLLLSIVNTHCPVAVSQESSVQTLLSSQTLATCWQPWTGSQLSVVQAFWSSQLSAPGVCVQPVAGLQASVVHTLSSLQATGTLIGVCVQPVAALQPSVVQALLSSQLMVWCWQPLTGSQLSAVHALLSLQ